MSKNEAVRELKYVKRVEIQNGVVVRPSLGRTSGADSFIVHR